MRRLTLRRRRQRNRFAHGVDQVAVRVVTLLWFVRVLVRGARFSGR